jgi:hypothetical protein
MRKFESSAAMKLSIRARAIDIYRDLRYARRYHRVGNLYRDLQQAARSYNVDWPYLLGRLFMLMHRGGFHPRESLEDGLLNPQVPEHILGAAVAKHRLIRLQLCVNPYALTSLTEHKALFYTYCMAWNLPIPRFYGLSAKPVGYSAAGQPLVKAEDWKEFAQSLPDEFIVKPSEGVYGRGFRLFRRDNGSFIDNEGRRHQAEDLGKATLTIPSYNSFVIQERLQSHPELVRLSGTSFLQTVRMVTWVRANGDVILPLALQKVIAADALVDNYIHGSSGNLCTLVDPQSGTLDAAIGPGASEGVMMAHTVHPRTGVQLEGFEIPLWKEACNLVRQAALRFLPLRTIGWDVAITSSGPILIEGNAWWDPFNIGIALTQRTELAEQMKSFLDELAASSNLPM